MRLVTVIVVAALLAVGMPPESSASASGSSKPRQQGSAAIGYGWTYSEAFRRFHFRAKRELGARYACLSSGSPVNGDPIRKRGPLELRVTTDRAVPAARRLAKTAPDAPSLGPDGDPVSAAPRVIVRVVDRRYGFERMQSIYRRLIATAPKPRVEVSPESFHVEVSRVVAYSMEGTRRGRCKPIEVHANGSPPGAEAPPEWYSTPEFKWAAAQRRRYGRDRVRAFAQFYGSPGAGIGNPTN